METSSMQRAPKKNAHTGRVQIDSVAAQHLQGTCLNTKADDCTGMQRTSTNNAHSCFLCFVFELYAASLDYAQPLLWLS